MKIVLTEVPFTKDRDMSVEKSCLPEGAELVVAVYDEHAEDNSEFYKLIEDADIIVNSYVYFGKKEIDTLKKCKVISFQSTGYNEVDMDYATEKGVAVCSILDYCTQETAENAFAMSSAAARNVFTTAACRWIRSGTTSPHSTCSASRARRWALSAWAVLVSPWQGRPRALT